LTKCKNGQIQTAADSYAKVDLQVWKQLEEEREDPNKKPGHAEMPKK
jgi:hypothetical protein